MQSTLTKRALQETLKVATRATKTNMKYFLFTQPLVQQTSSLSLSSTFTRGFTEENGQFEKVTSYESLISRICNANNINDLLGIMQQNIGLYKNEHIVLTLRVLARLIKSTNTSQVESLNKDERYKTLTSKAQESLEEFNEYEILDFLFWLRRFKTARLPTHVSEESLNKLYNKVKDFVKSKSFNFRNLVNLYYDLSCLNRNTDDIAAEILNELKADFKLLTPFTIVQILQAASRKRGSASPQEFQVADYVQKNLGTMLQEFDSDQKCLVFKYLSVLEMHINPPKYKVPFILYKLKTELKDILDQLSEIGVINILDAYGDLPREFPNDLLEEIKEMVIVTIQHNSENIKSFFLIDFLDKVLNLSRGRKPTEDKIIIIYEEIAKRILNDEYTSRFKSLERLLNIYEKAGIQYQPLLDKVVQRITEYPGTFFSGPILRCLNKNGKDITPILDKYLESSDLSNASYGQCFQLFVVLSEVKSDKYASVLEELKTKITSNPDVASKLITSIPLSYNKNVEEVLEVIIQHVQQTKNNFSDFNFYKLMFLTTASKKTRQIWTDWAKDNLTNIEKQSANRLLDTFFSISEMTTDRILLFTLLIDKIPEENISFRKIITNFKDNKDFIFELNKLETRFQKFLVKILRLMDVHSREVRLSVIYSFVKRMESLNIRSALVPLIARKGFEITKSSNAPINIQLEIYYADYLIDQGTLRIEDAQQIYEKIKDSKDDVFLVSKILSYILQRTPKSAIEENKADINKNLEVLIQNLNETGARTVLNSLATILAFPPEIIEPHRDLIIKSIKSFLNFGNQQLYSAVLNALVPRYVKSNYDFYVPIIRELITNYNNFNKRMNPGDIVRTLYKFSEFNTRNPTIYNHILTDVGRIFNVFKNDELADIVVAFTRIKIKQTDLFDKILSKIAAHPANFAQNIRYIIKGFFHVGFNSPQAKASIVDIFNKLGKSPINGLAFAQYLTILNLENEVELLQTVLNEESKISIIKSFNIGELFALIEYLNIVHKDQPQLAEAVRKVIPNYEEISAKGKRETQTIVKAKKLIGDYLSIMKINYETDFSIDGYNIDLYIPEKKNLIKIFLQPEINFDRISLTGKGLQTKRIYQSFEGYTTTFINMAEFKSIPENMNKINHLIALGIENNNKEGTYDFSRVLQNDIKEEELVEESETQEEIGGVDESIIEEVEEAAKIQS